MYRRKSLLFSALLVSIAFFGGNVYASGFFNYMTGESAHPSYPQLDFQVTSGWCYDTYLSVGQHSYYTNPDYFCSGSESVAVYMHPFYDPYNKGDEIYSGEIGQHGWVTFSGTESTYQCTGYQGS